MIRVTVEIDDDLFGKSNVERDGKTVEVKPADMTDDELIELVLAPDTDLDQFAKVVEVERSRGDSISVLQRDKIEEVAKRIDHPQSRERYSRRRR